MTKNQEPKPLITFTFDVIGDGKTVFCGKFETIDIELALGKARAICKNLSLPGWQLKCRENGMTFPAVEFKNAQGDKQYL